MVRARIEPGLKTKAEKYFDILGLSTTQAITLFFKQVELHHGLPFEINIPNAETMAAMKEIEDGGGKQTARQAHGRNHGGHREPAARS